MPESGHWLHELCRSVVVDLDRCRLSTNCWAEQRLNSQMTSSETQIKPNVSSPNSLSNMRFNEHPLGVMIPGHPHWLWLAEQRLNPANDNIIAKCGFSVTPSRTRVLASLTSGPLPITTVSVREIGPRAQVLVRIRTPTMSYHLFPMQPGSFRVFEEQFLLLWVDGLTEKSC